LGVYVIAQDLNVPLIVQPQLFGLFSLLCWGQCLYYGPTARSRAWCAVVIGGTLVLWGALEAAMVSALRVRVFILYSPSTPSTSLSGLVYTREGEGPHLISRVLS
jgi:hypothetical protein